MKKNRHHPSGKQRWYCTACRASQILTYKPNYRHEKELEEFVDWLTDTIPQRFIASVSRTWRRRHSWCWDIHPVWEPTGEVHDQIIIDAKHLPYKWCVLIARTADYVIGYQLADSESKAAYSALLAQFPAPKVVVTDGAKGSLSAIKEQWETTKIQRCLVHIQRNITAVTSTHPRLIQHKALRQLGFDLLKVATREQAIEWIGKLARFNEIWESWLNEKTYRDQVTPEQIPIFARRNKKWWYTHKPTRSLVRSLNKYVRDGVLFTFLDPQIQTETTLLRDTNRIEGDTNKHIAELLGAHRGITESHMLTMIDWYLYKQTETHKNPAQFATKTANPGAPQHHEEADQPHQYHVNIDQQAPWEDGLTIRKGHPK